MVNDDTAAFDWKTALNGDHKMEPVDISQYLGNFSIPLTHLQIVICAPESFLHEVFVVCVGKSCHWSGVHFNRFDWSIVFSNISASNNHVVQDREQRGLLSFALTLTHLGYLRFHSWGTFFKSLCWKSHLLLRVRWQEAHYNWVPVTLLQPLRNSHLMLVRSR